MNSRLAATKDLLNNALKALKKRPYISRLN